MAGITLAQAETKLTEAMDALSSAMDAQQYAVGNRSVTRANLESLHKAVTFWDAQVKRLSRGGGIRITGAVPY